MIILKAIDVRPYTKGKRWDIIKNAIDHPVILDLSLGNGTGYRVIFFRFIHEGKLFVGIERIGCFLSPEGHYVTPAYVAGKLNLQHGDADNLADWLNAQLNVDVKEFGYYCDGLCIDRIYREQ